jgi:hypothetical protein
MGITGYMRTLKAGLVSLVMLSAACGASQSPSPSPAPKPGTAPVESSESEHRTRVEIDNQNFSDMDIYLINRGTRVRLGSATGLSKTTLLLPGAALAGGWQVSLQADPIGGAAPIRTPALLVAPGQNVYWTIGADPTSSFASVG